MKIAAATGSPCRWRYPKTQPTELTCLDLLFAACLNLSGPVSCIHRLPLFISSLQQLVNRPRFICIPRWNISILERRAAHNVIEAFSVIAVDVLFRIMQVYPASHLHGQFFGMPLGFFEIRVVPLLPIFESRSLCAGDAFKPFVL